MKKSSSKRKEKHLFVLIHGLWGNYKHMDSLLKSFNKYLPNDEFVYFTPTQNARFKTLDGIEIVGYRTLIELCQFINYYNNKNLDSKLTKISILGYSMGGLIARFIIGKMSTDCKDFFKNLTPYLFITLATPHLGVNFYNPSSPIKSILYKTLKFLGSHFIGKSGSELFIKDGNDPILKKLSQGPYFDQLSQFKYRVVLANTKNDRTVAFYTSFITNIDPFIQYHRKLKLYFDKNIPGNYTKGIPNIIDMDALIPGQLHHPTLQQNASKWKLIYIIPLFTLLFTIFIPIGFTLNICATIYSYFATREYTRMIQSDELPNHIQQKLTETDRLKDAILDTYNSIYDEFEDTTSDNLEDTPEDNMIKHSIRKDGLSSSIISRDSSYTETNEISNNTNSDIMWEEFIRKYSNNWIGKNSENFDALPFDSNRKTIVNNLDRLDWIRIPVYIKAQNAHAGIVARRGFNDRTPKTSYASVEFTGQLVNFLMKGWNEEYEIV